MGSDKDSGVDLKDIREKLGEWIEAEADTHFMPFELLDGLGHSEASFEYKGGVAYVRGVVQVETETGSVGLVETRVPLHIVKMWLRDDTDTDNEDD